MKNKTYIYQNISPRNISSTSFVRGHSTKFGHLLTGGEGGQLKSDILLTHADGGKGARSILYKIILWMREKNNENVQIMK